ncbi:hypothetical protein J7552_09520 [Wohlfahrtiimonas chitiniclastica]|uniref:YobI family P-loop NTPase n=1 Tax=Wohlfahrtiimonas chitiniclastica TaxID=400946 RepID=UPI001BCFD4F2|nr:hypothetical protein [Wohlfahrtiimonas chitiniclastica]MBS7821516.1 hypothetical protein [Wohlfahrtiimonas chitiniclastica]
MAFKSLLPTHLTTELEPYQEAFDFALDPKNKNITNIAVTGNYGAGKSSVISSYFHQKNQNKTTEHVDDCFLRKPISNKEITISLATFKLRSTDSTGSSDKPNSGSETSQQLDKNNTTAIQNIEFNILQQLIHKTHPNQLPKSRFERIIHKHNDNEYVFSTITIVLLLLTFVSIGLISEWKFLEKFSDLIGFEPNPLFIFIPAFSILALIILATRYCVHSNLFHKKDMQSIDILKGQVAFKNKDNQSVLNLFLDEILYFFEQTHYDVVIFEDLDRLEHKEIFIRLREINLIINNSEQVQRPIKFIYAIKDDLFEDQESRVKFFDFIIPIIPVVDFDNSYKHLQEEIKRIDIKVFEALNEGRLLRDVSNRIHDMRLLINIINEYTIYLAKERINNNSDTQDNDVSIETPNIGDTNEQDKAAVTSQRLRKIFALIVYKNFMPEDFSLIQSKNSILCKIVSNYRNGQLLYTILKKWNEEYQENTEALQLLKNSKQGHFDLIKIKLLNELLFSEHKDEEIYVGNYLHHQDSILFDKQDKISFFNETLQRDKELEPLSFNKNQNYTDFQTNQISAEQVNACLDKYEKEIKKIEDDIKNKKQILQKLKDDIDHKYSFSEALQLLQQEDKQDSWQNEYLNDQNIKEKPIIFMLIRRGYIDQSYINYISLSHENAYELREFRNALSDNIDFEHTFSLPFTSETIETFLKEDDDILNEHAMTQPILNGSLISYLLKHKNSFTGPAKLENFPFLFNILDFHYFGNSIHIAFLLKYIPWCLNRSEYKIHAPQLVQEIFTNTKALQYFFKEIQAQNFNGLPEGIKEILLLILMTTSHQNIEISKIKSILLSDFDLINCFDYLELHDQPVDNVISWLQEAKIKIDLATPNIDVHSFSYKLFKAVIDNSLYHITDQNIQRILEYNGYTTEALNTMHYSTLCNKYSNDTAIRKYIEENITIYVNNILLKKDEYILNEEHAVIIELLNKSKLSNEQRMQIISQKTDFIINDLSNINKNILIKKDKQGSDSSQNAGINNFITEMLNLYFKSKAPRLIIKPTWHNTYQILLVLLDENSDNELTHKWMNKFYSEIVNSELNSKIINSNVFKERITLNPCIDQRPYSTLTKKLQIQLTIEDLDGINQLEWYQIQTLMHLKLLEPSIEMTNMVYKTFINPTQEEDDE